MKKTFLLVLLAILAVVQTQAQGKLWGLSTYGGPDGLGAIFRANADGTGVVFEKNFEFENPGKEPYGDLVLAGNGKLYGMTSIGGPEGYGILFEYDPATNSYTKQFEFSSASGNSPRGSLTLGSNNKLYGMTVEGGASNFGVLFSFDPATGIYSKIIEFNGTNGKYPFGSVTVGSNGKIYGMTSAGGTSNTGVLFEFDPVAVIYNTMFSFTGANGLIPYGSLALGGNGKLYGVTEAGGATGYGVIFEYDPATSIYAKKYDFNSGNNGSLPYEGLTLGSNNKLYGMTKDGGTNGSGVLYEFDPAGAGTYTKKLDFSGTNGVMPFGRMALGSNNKLYGMTEQGGTGSKGVLFEYDPATNTYTKKIDFTGASNGGFPRGGLTRIGNGKFYGMTTYGGAADKGVLFEFDPTTSTHTKKLDFNSTGNGREPGESLVMASNNKLYGTTPYGGTSDKGILYEFDQLTLQFTKKIDFNGANGRSPVGKLITVSNGKLYGVTFGGGTTDTGVLFEYDPVTNIFTKKIDFLGFASGITLGSNNKLYGTLSGGALSFGVLFEYDLATSTYTKKLDFAGGADGSGPVGSLLQSSNGKFYGLMYEGGTSNFGTLFEYDPATNAYTKKADFNGTNGRNPRSGLTEGSNGKLYGTTYEGGTSSVGVLFEFDPSTGILTNKLNFTNGANGKLPRGGLTLSGNGKLYGMTSGGGLLDAGVLFEYDPITNTYTKKGDFENDYPEGTLFFEKANQIIMFNALANKTMEDAPFNLTAVASSALPVTYLSSNSAVATVSGNIVTIVGSGTTTITASQAGNASYNAAPEVPQTFTVNKINQTITFSALSDKTLGDAAFTVSATSTSLLAVGFSSGSDKLTIAGNQVTIVKAGRATITAAQAGNASYNAAVSVDRSFCIKPAKPTITLSNNNTESPTLSSNATVGNQWFLNGTLIPGATNVALNVTAMGVYQVQVKVDDCVSDFSTEKPIIVTGDIANENPSIEIFPNPVSEWLTVQLGKAQGTKSVALYQLNGTQTDAKETTSNEAEFHVANYSAGVYVVKVKTDGEVKVMRFVKQ